MAIAIRSTATSASSSNLSTHTGLALPGTIEEGDLVLILLTNDSGSSQHNIADFDDGSWDRLYNLGDNTCTAACFYKTADAALAARAGGSIEFDIVLSADGTTADSEQYSAIAYAISGASGTVEASASYDNGVSSPDGTGLDPIVFNSVTPVGGSAEYLWIAALHKYNGGSALVRAYPSGYSGGTENYGDSLASQRPTTAASYKISTASSETPGNMTVGSDDPPTTNGFGGTSYAIAVSPASGGGTSVAPLAMVNSATIATPSLWLPSNRKFTY